MLKIQARIFNPVMDYIYVMMVIMKMFKYIVASYYFKTVDYRDIVC